MIDQDEALEAYLQAHSSFRSPLLDELYRTACVRLLQPRMICGASQADFLAMLVRLTSARCILELGAYSGYSTIALGLAAAQQGGVVHSIECDPEMIHFLTPFVERSDCASQIQIHEGDALTLMPQLMKDLSFDFVYMDANKRQYPDYYEMLLQYLTTGAVIVADNTLWDGKVFSTDAHRHTDAQLTGIEQFNDRVAADPRVEQMTLPLRDGLTIIRVL